MPIRKNEIRLVGNLGKDPEKKTTPNGEVVTFSLAVDDPPTENNKTPHTNWFQVDVWGTLTKVAAGLKAGDAVEVDGSVKIDSYTKDSVKHKTIVVRCNSIIRIDYSKSDPTE